MTNRLETALEQTASVFMEMAQEIRAMRVEIEELQILTHKHESVNENLSKMFNNFYK
jgi:hypothetical protein